MNTDEFRDALLDQERFAPDGQAVLDDLATPTRPQLTHSPATPTSSTAR